MTHSCSYDVDDAHEDKEKFFQIAEDASVGGAALGGRMP